MKEFDAVEMIGTSDTGFIISMDDDNFCRVIGENINARIPAHQLKPLGYTLAEFLAQHNPENSRKELVYAYDKGYDIGFINGAQAARDEVFELLSEVKDKIKVKYDETESKR